MTFELITEPRNKTKPEILFFMLLKISYDDGTLTNDILENKKLYRKYKKSIYQQFTKLSLTTYKESLKLTDHTSQKKGDKKGQCLCTQLGITIYNMIENSITKKKCWVGSVCIDKFLPQLKKQKNELLRINKYKDQGYICLYCNDVLPSRRKKVNKEMFCNLNCKSKMNYVIPFGKHKGKIMIELICTREGSEYIDWVKNVIEDDTTAFSKYPLFLEILEENIIDLI